jgi:regulator of sigma E protease
VIGKILPDSAAAAAGLMPGDKIVAADGVTMARFEDLQRTVMLNSGEPMRLSVVREGATIDIAVTPRVIAEKDLLGNVEKVGLLGVQASGELVMRHEDPATALWQGARETWSITANSLETVWQMIVGRRSADGLSGPIGIGQLSGEVWREGFIPVVHFIALLSINLGLINLFPIPVLDGGHLLFYAIEGVRRRPLDERAIAFGFRVGFALIVSFFVFVMWHDLARLMHVAPGT